MYSTIGCTASTFVMHIRCVNSELKHWYILNNKVKSFNFYYCENLTEMCALSPRRCVLGLQRKYVVFGLV